MAAYFDHDKGPGVLTNPTNTSMHQTLQSPICNFVTDFGVLLAFLTCSCPRMMTPPGLMGCQAARLSPVPSFSPSWKASHWPSRVVQEMQMWCHLPSRTSRGSWATCGPNKMHLVMDCFYKTHVRYGCWKKGYSLWWLTNIQSGWI